VIFHLLSSCEAFEDLGGDYFQRRHDPTDKPAAWLPNVTITAA